MHIHKYTPWKAKFPTPESVIAQFEAMLRRNGVRDQKIVLKDIDERTCEKCGKRQQREVKP